jgi:hypothetical protein
LSEDESAVEVRKETLVNRKTSTYAMSISEIAASLEISERAVRFILRKAIAKLHSHPQLCAGFRAAVKERRRALDARPGNGPWDYARPMTLSTQGD